MSSNKVFENNQYRQQLIEELLEDYNNKKKEVEEEDGEYSLCPRILQKPAILQILGASFDFSECSAHHTSRFDMTKGQRPKAVFRRGQPFNINIRINRPYKPEEDLLTLILLYGPQPSFNNGTKYSIPVLSANNTKKQWKAELTGHSENSLTVKVHCPANSQIGRWIFKIFVQSKISTENKLFESAENVLHILFNPWCEDDEVFLADEKQREKYVLDDHGVIARGTVNRQTYKRWIYGQYDFSVLSALILLLEDRSEVPYFERGSATLICRTLSSLMSANDNSGLLWGKWQGPYNEGTSPEAWTGSVGIYDEFLRSKGTPVKYAQCWVFAGCLTTACRALGIPCRSVTCYSAAHDKDKTLNIEHYINDDNMRERSKYDIIWNYHCWNEVWLSRRDLPRGFSGWQVIDGTPQELSGGGFRLGPSPVQAVKEGLIGLNFDVMFVFSEVSAHVLYFIKRNNQYYLDRVETDTVGKLLLTEKLPPNNEPKDSQEDITDSYKYSPDSEKGIEAFNRALSLNPHKHGVPKFEKKPEEPKDVVFKLEKITTVRYGESFTVNLHIENNTDEKRTVEANLLIKVVLYTGTDVATIKDEDAKVGLNPQEKKCARLVIEKEDYKNAVGKSFNIKVQADCKVIETKQQYSTVEVFEMDMIPLKINMPQNVTVKSKIEATLSFTNPLSVELTSCRLVFEGPGVYRPETIAIPNVPANGEMRKTLKLKARRVGSCTFNATFTSEQLSHIIGHGTVTVQA